MKTTLRLFLITLIFLCGTRLYANDSDTTALKKWLDASVEDEIKEQLANLPNIEVGRGLTFGPKDNSFKTTIRFRMQNMGEFSFDNKMKLTEADGQVKRLRLRFDGYIFSPKLLYSIQLGFTGKDAKATPNGKSNLVMDAIAYYKPNDAWNFGFGQTKVKTNRSLINSSGALQFADRSIVNSEFAADRDFGLFGEYHYGSTGRFALTALASITMGEGRNWGASDNGGLLYSGRLELFPFGKFNAKGEYIEGDTYYETSPKLMIGGGYAFNNHAAMTQGCKGSLLPGNERRNIGGYYADIVLKYRGFALNADYMGRHAAHATNMGSDTFIYTGSGVNLQASYIFARKWEVAIRNSTMMPHRAVQPFVGYKTWNQSTLGITRYIIGHSLKVQADISYNRMSQTITNDYDRLTFRFQLELGL